MLLADVVRTSNQVAAVSSRNAKVSLIADLLRRCALLVADGAAPATEIGLATRYLTGSLRQRRTGIELSSLSEMPSPAVAGDVTLHSHHAATQRSTVMASARSHREPAERYLSLRRRLTHLCPTFGTGFAV